MSLDADSSMQEKRDYSLILDHILVDGERMSVLGMDSCRIRPDAHRIEFEVHVLSYQVEKPDVFYRLEGFDSDRTEMSLTSLGDISYTNLDAGDYVFHFGILNPDGEELTQLQFRITKQPRWYEMLYVRLLMIAIVCAALIFFMWRYVKKIMRDEEQALRQRLEAEELDRRLQRLHERADEVRIQDVALSFCEGIYEADRENFSFDEGLTMADMDLLRNKDLFHGRV